MSSDFFETHYAQQQAEARRKEEATYPRLVQQYNRCVDVMPEIVKYVLDKYQSSPPSSYYEVKFEGKTHIGWRFASRQYDGDCNIEVMILASGLLVCRNVYKYGDPYVPWNLARLRLSDEDIPGRHRRLNDYFRVLLTNPPAEDADAFRARFARYAPSYDETPLSKSTPRPPQPPSPHQVARSNQRQQAEAFALRNEHAIRDAYSNNRRRCRIPINLAMLNRRYPGITEGEPLVDTLYRALQARIGYTFAIDRTRTNDRYLWITFSDEDATKREERARNDARVRRYLDSGTNRQPAAPAQEQKRRTLGQVISDFLR